MKAPEAHIAVIRSCCCCGVTQQKLGDRKGIDRRRTANDDDDTEDEEGLASSFAVVQAEKGITMVGFGRTISLSLWVVAVLLRTKTNDSQWIRVASRASLRAME